MLWIMKTYRQLVSLVTLLLGEVEWGGLHYAFLYDIFVGEGSSFSESTSKHSKTLANISQVNFPSGFSRN
jgi:hypothetical protein